MANLNNYLNKIIKNNSLNKVNKNIYLTNYELEVLQKNNILYETCSNYNQIIFYIEEILSEESNEELETISLSISERNYYQNTKK